MRVLDALLVLPLGGVPEQTPTLARAFAGDFLVGAALGEQTLLGKDAISAPLLGQFNAFTAENGMKPDATQPREGVFRFEQADKLVEIARRNNATVVGHTLVWHSQTPAWFFEGPNGKPVSRELALKRLRERIAALVGRYKGKVTQWDVVNEAISDSGNEMLRPSPWQKAIGDDYIAEAFRAARAADPNAVLIYNDYNIENPGKREKALKMLKSLRDQGVPIDAVGIQGHWGLNYPDLQTIETAITDFAALGLKVMITELDVSVLPTRYQGADVGAGQAAREEALDPYVADLPESVARRQAERYRAICALLRRHRDVVDRVTFWGVHDGQSWKNNFPIRGRTDYPLVFDRQGKPKQAFFALTALQASRPPAAATLPSPVEMTAAQDHRRLLDLLNITALRPGANGSGDPNAPNAANYDESKANPYPNLPDPLVLKNGRKVTTAKQWWEQRRPEIVEDFDREIYGRVPQNTPKVTWEATVTTREMNGDVPVLTKQLVGRVDNAAYPLRAVYLQMTLTTPANAAGPVPVMLQFGFPGGFGGGFGRAPGGPNSEPTWQQQVLARGWGYAVLSPNSIQPDNGAGLTQGIIGLVNRGKPRKVDDWGALRAWAWGASRALDYFETDPAVDARQVGLEGHSRYGKAALVAMAYDPRFAIAYVSSSGEGGAKLHRRSWGELVENVAGSGEYHWMAGNFLKYAGPLNWGDLPVDSHELVALCAPRPVFLGAGATQGDGWVDAKGTFLAGAGAGPVYKLLGGKDLGATEFPPIETALIAGDVAFRQHSGGHTDGPNWPTFLTFATRYLKGPALPTARQQPAANVQ